MANDHPHLALRIAKQTNSRRRGQVRSITNHYGTKYTLLTLPILYIEHGSLLLGAMDILLYDPLCCIFPPDPFD
jgi:hypothetical protein